MTLGWPPGLIAAIHSDSEDDIVELRHVSSDAEIFELLPLASGLAVLPR